MTKFRNAYSQPVVVGHKFEKPSLTKSEFANDCDLNALVARFKERGVDLENQPSPMFDPSSVVDYDAIDLQDALNVYGDISEAFEALPSQERLKFDNDPLAWFQTEQEKTMSNIPPLQEESPTVGSVPATEPVAPTQASPAEVDEQ